MEASNYLDFDLSIERMGESTYRARVLASPAGLAKVDFNLPLSALEIENFVLKVGRMRRTVRRIESTEMQAAKEFGSKLYKAVFSDEVQSALRSSLDQARAQDSGLRIRLRLNDAPELVNIPWEYLYNSSLNRFLALSVNTPVVRYLELPESIRPLSVKTPLRVLVMIANPKDFPALDVEVEWQNLKKAVSDLEEQGLLILERLEAATPIALQYRLRREDFHIFHFIGHGGFDESAQDGLLMLENESGLGKALSGQSLGTILHDENTLRLVVLNACEGARTGTNDPFAGAAQSLVQQGLPAVIAMQFEVSDQAAITFAHEFYAALADGYPVDAALSEARKVIFSSGNEIEWGTPVLYLRASDGQIFNIVRPAHAPQEEKFSQPRPAIPEPVKPHVKAEREPAAQKRAARTETKNAKAAALPKLQIHWRAVGAIALCVWIGWALFFYWQDQLIWESHLVALLFGAGSGLAVGLGMVVAIHSLGFHQDRRRLASSILAWMSGIGITAMMLGYLVQASVDTSDILLMSLLGIIFFSLAILPGTLATVAGLQTGQAGFKWQVVWLLLAGWLVSLTVILLTLYLYNNNVDYDQPTVFYLGGGLTGVAVGLWTQWMLRKYKTL
jgi:CHAT domain-containing protein